MPSQSTQDPVDKAIITAGGYVFSSLIALSMGYALARRNQQAVQSWLKNARFNWPHSFEFQGTLPPTFHLKLPKIFGLTGRLIIIWIIGLIACNGANPPAFGGRLGLMATAYLGVTVIIVFSYLLIRYSMGLGIRALTADMSQEEVFPSKPVSQLIPPNPASIIMYTIALPKSSEWRPEIATAFMEQILQKTYRLSFRIVAAKGTIRWQIVTLAGDSAASIVEQAVRTYYPDAEIENPTKLDTFQKPFYRCTTRFTQGEMVICPLLDAHHFGKLDPLASLAQEMSSLRAGEYIIYTLYVGQFASFAYPQMLDLLSMPAPTSPLAWLSPQTQYEAAYSSIVGKPRIALYPPGDQSIFEQRLSKNLYQAVLMVQVNAPTESRARELALITTQIKQFEREDYPNILYPADVKLEYIVNANQEWKSNSIGLILSWIEGTSHTWQQGSLILEPREMAALWHFPHLDFRAPGIRWARSKQVPVPEELARNREGVYIGQNVYVNYSTPIYMRYGDRATHTAIFGMTGTGKTNLLHTLITQDIANSKGVCVVDPLGNLVRNILRYSIPKEREKDVVVLDVANSQYPPPLNIMSLPTEAGVELATSQVINILTKLFPEMQGTRWADTLAMSLLTLRTEKFATVRDVHKLLSDTAYRDRLLARIDNEAIYDFWQDFERRSVSMQDELADPIKRRLRAFYGNPYFYPIVCNPQGLDFAKLMQERKIILVSLGVEQSKLTSYERRLLGALIISQIQMAATSHAAEKRGYYLFVDEAQEFITTSLPTMLTQARQFNLSLTLANQYLRQLVGNTLEAVRGDVGAFFFFQLGDEDAGIASRYTRPGFDADALMRMDKYQAAVRMRLGTTTLPAFSLATHLAYDPRRQKAGMQAEARIRALSIQQYTRGSRQAVMKWLDQRYPRKKSSSSNQDEFSDPV